MTLIPIVSVVTCASSASHPSDEQMSKEFVQRRSEFELLLAMIKSERRVTRIAYDFIWVDGARNPSAEERPTYLPDKRWREYRRLFDLLQLESGVVRREDGSVSFLRSSQGIVPSGSSKEFVWSPKPVPGRLPRNSGIDLEDACEPKGDCWVEKVLDAGWSVAFEAT